MKGEVKSHIGRVKRPFTKMQAVFKIINWDGRSYEYIEISLIGDDALLIEELKQRAVDLARVVRPEDPGGWRRDDYTKYCRCLVGVIAEAAFRHCVIAFGECKHIRFEHPQFGSLYDQIDIRLTVDERPLQVEVRSSCSYKMSLERVFTGAFSIIGWYKTLTKPSEKPKDYYAQIVYYFDANEVEKQLEKGLVLHFVGGASRQLLESSGQWDSLRKLGASYRVIRPIVIGTEPRELIAEMTRCNQNQTADLGRA